MHSWQSVTYTYEDDQLTKIETESTTYSFTYGSFGLRSKVSVGNNTLASYTYTNDKNNYLKKLAYGNGDSVEYTYDDEGRVTKKTYEDGTSVSYQYDDSGFWTSNTDSVTGITTTYTYDYEGRLRLYEETGTDYSFSLRYTYNSKNQLIHILELVDGHDRGTRYTYDEDNRLTKFKKAHSIRTYAYDAFSRVSSTQTLHDDTVIYDTDYTFTAPSDTTTSGQVASMRNQSAGYDVTYSYTYDDNGNITSISDGTYTTSYAYDTANQLVRENNQEAGYTHTWTYDNAGNILSRTEYAYTTEENLGSITPTDTVTYTYGAQQWGDMLTNYDGTFLYYDGIGNLTDDGTWEYTWQHGRQLASMSDGTTTWSYTYNADGMRIGRTDGTTTYEYIYAGSEIIYTIINGVPLRFSHTADGTPLSVVYKGGTYYYVTNLQGDVVAILDEAGNQVVGYSYDAWGNILSTTGRMADTLGAANPLRYRGYVYDNETELYYLQSRYYDPEIGRFINADGLISTGQGLLGYNMFAYCINNPINYFDSSGYSSASILGSFQLAFTEAIKSLKDLFVIAAAVTQVDSPALGIADVIGGAIAVGALAACTAVAVSKVVDDVAEDIAVAVDTVVKKWQDTTMYYGADMYGGTWKIVTPPMNYETATMWVGATAAAGVYGKNASWGLYTADQDSALKMALTLGGPGPHLHSGNIGQYNHYHVFGMLLFGEYKHFHIWYGNIWGE